MNRSGRRGQGSHPTLHGADMARTLTFVRGSPSSGSLESPPFSSAEVRSCSGSDRSHGRGREFKSRIAHIVPLGIAAESGSRVVGLMARIWPGFGQFVWYHARFPERAEVAGCRIVGLVLIPDHAVGYSSTLVRVSRRSALRMNVSITDKQSNRRRPKLAVPVGDRGQTTPWPLWNTHLHVEVDVVCGDPCRTASAAPTSQCDRPDWRFIKPDLRAGGLRTGTGGARDDLAMRVTLIS